MICCCCSGSMGGTDDLDRFRDDFWTGSGCTEATVVMMPPVNGYVLVMLHISNQGKMFHLAAVVR